MSRTALRTVTNNFIDEYHVQFQISLAIKFLRHSLRHFLRTILKIFLTQSYQSYGFMYGHNSSLKLIIEMLRLSEITYLQNYFALFSMFYHLT